MDSSVSLCNSDEVFPAKIGSVGSFLESTALLAMGDSILVPAKFYLRAGGV
jgi:hypothetical protein